MINESQKQPPLRERAMKVASRLIRENGYEGTRLEDIAAELGVTAPALYWHFASKSELFYAILRQIIEEFRVLSDEAFESNPGHPDLILRAVVEAHTLNQLHGLDRAQSYTGMTFVHSQKNSWMTPEQAVAVRDAGRDYFRRLRQIVQDGRDLGIFDVADVTVATFAVINMCEFSHLWYQDNRELTIHEVAQIHGDFALRIVGYSQNSMS